MALILKQNDMKKILVSVLAVIAFSMTSNAQLWFGGNVSASHSGSLEKKHVYPGGTTVDTVLTKSNSFTIAPKIGFGLNEKLSVGIAPSFSTSTSSKVDKDNLIKTNTFGVIPFVRYTFVEFGNFGILAEADLPISFGNGKWVMNGTETKMNPTSSFGLTVTPWLTYSVSDNFSLECGLNFLRLYATHDVEKDQSDKDHKWVDNAMGCGVNSSLVNVGGMTIGFIYKL